MDQVRQPSSAMLHPKGMIQVHDPRGPRDLLSLPWSPLPRKAQAGPDRLSTGPPPEGPRAGRLRLRLPLSRQGSERRLDPADEEQKRRVGGGTERVSPWPGSNFCGAPPATRRGLFRQICHCHESPNRDDSSQIDGSRFVAIRPSRFVTNCRDSSAAKAAPRPERAPPAVAFGRPAGRP